MESYKNISSIEITATDLCKPAWQDEKPETHLEDGKVLQFSIFEGNNLIKNEHFYKEKVIVGKSEEADLVLQGRNISNIHAFFYVHGDQISVSDGNLGSGIMVNGRFISTRVLTPSDSVLIGPFTLKIKLDQDTRQISEVNPLLSEGLKDKKDAKWMEEKKDVEDPLKEVESCTDVLQVSHSENRHQENAPDPISHDSECQNSEISYRETGLVEISSAEAAAEAVQIPSPEEEEAQMEARILLPEEQEVLEVQPALPEEQEAQIKVQPASLEALEAAAQTQITPSVETEEVLLTTFEEAPEVPLPLPEEQEALLEVQPASLEALEAAAQTQITPSVETEEIEIPSAEAAAEAVQTLLPEEQEAQREAQPLLPEEQEIQPDDQTALPEEQE
ncbi:MAG: FHA domain-containing protein, partial [bacterium]